MPLVAEDKRQNITFRFPVDTCISEETKISNAMNTESYICKYKNIRMAS